MLAKSLPYWPINPKLSTSPWFTFQIDLVRAIWAIFPATVLWGASFPLALAAVASADDDPARPVGSVYAANTSGAIVGALAFSMILIPRMGTQAVRACADCAFRRERAVCTVSRHLVLARSKASDVVAGGFDGDRWLSGMDRTRGFRRDWSPMAASLRRQATPRILYVGEGLNSSIAISQFGNTRQFQ